MRSSVTRSLLVVALSALGLLAACSGGGGNAPATVGQSILPCDDGLPSFDVWQVNFRPDGRTQLVLSVDTIGPVYASEFRLTFACQGVVVFSTIQGAACTFPPPSNGSGETPQCPFESMPLGDLANLARVGCLAEIVPTQPLDIGVGACADPSRADYKLRVTLDDQPLSLVLVAHNCRTDESCLQANFGINVGD
jgi:hypothetical protein